MPTAPSTLPTIPEQRPVRTMDQVTFDEAWAQFLAFWYVFYPNMQPELQRVYDNALEAYNSATSATSSAGAAAASAILAASYATNAVNSPGTTATSANSVTIPTSVPTSVAMTIQTGKSIVPGQFMIHTATASPKNWFITQCTSYTSGTGAYVGDAFYVQGVGTFNAWSIALVAPPMSTVTNAIQTKNGPFTAVAQDKGSVFKVSGTWTMSFIAAATLGGGWYCYVLNTGGGTVTFDPNGSELINGQAAYGTCAKGQMYLITCDGSAFDCKRVSGPKPRFKLSDQKASGTGGGTPVSSDITQVRTLNTVEINTMFGASLSSNRPSVPAGVLTVTGRAPACLGGGSGPHKCFLYNVTDSAYQSIGSSALAYASALVQTDSVINDQITLSAPKTFEIRHFTGSGTGTLGAAVSSGQVEKYTELLFELED